MGRRIWSALLAGVSVAALCGVATPATIAAAPLEGSLNAVSCPTETSCFAFGYGDAPFAMRWTGGQWAAADFPVPNGVSVRPSLNVSCATANRCVAIGIARRGSEVHPFVANWNGLKWATKLLPLGAAHWSFTALSCATPSMCVAVGNTYMSTGDRHPLALRWNGSKWSLMGVPRTNESQLDGISCRTAGSCVAVGSRSTKGNIRPYTVRWNGKGWSTMSTPMPSDARFVSLGGVACPTATRCFAAGTAHGPGTTHSWGLLLSWSGSGWSIVPTPKSPQFWYLGPLACAGPSRCFALGTLGLEHDRPVIEQWDGSAWSRTPGPTVPGADTVVLSDVSCGSLTSCHAVGAWWVDGKPSHVLTERWDGTSWSRS